MIKRAVPIAFAILISTFWEITVAAEQSANVPEASRTLLMANSASTEMVWNEIFTNNRQRYAGPTFVFYTQSTQTACGMVLNTMGPLYCASDRKIYLDLSFFRELEDRFGGCAGAGLCTTVNAYVTAWLVGRHVQNLLGVLLKVQETQRKLDRVSANRLQLRMELQTDCVVGLSMKHTIERQIAEGQSQSIDLEGLKMAVMAVPKIGEGTLREPASGLAMPYSNFHGTFDQRQRWLVNGFQEGTLTACNTFRAAGP
jgi:uncharacterized protein